MRENLRRFGEIISKYIWIIVLWVLTFFVSLVLFCTCNLKSLRGSVSDSITISSIILAILGILLSMIISMDNNSEFVKRARRYNVKEQILSNLFKRILFNFELNIFIIIFTLIYDIVPSVRNIFLKNGVNALWTMLFLGSIYEVLFIVKLIGNIYLFKVDKTEERCET